MTRIASWFVCMLLAASLCLGADVYPSKTVRILVPFGPGGTSDLLARALSPQLSEQLGKSFVVENRTGAGGTIGYALLAKSPPDGYTVLLVDYGFAIAPGLSKSLPYDPVKDFTPITQITRSAQVLAVNPALNVGTLREFIALVQANPGKYNYGSGGIGSTPHLFGELFKIAAKVNMVHVPYRGGGGDAMIALLGNQVQMVITGAVTVMPHIKNGQLRALAVTTTDGKRLPTLPDVPAMSEAGISGITVSGWHGLLGPGGMPRDVVNRLYAEVLKALTPEVRERFSAQGGQPVGSSPDEFSALIRNDLQRWAEVIKSAGITPE